MIKNAIILIITIFSTGCALKPSYQAMMDAKTANKVEEIIKNVSTQAETDSHGDTKNALSAAFLGTPYAENTLIGSSDTNEVLVANFDSVDCFTFIDYVKALEGATDKNSFLKNLVDTRYVGGKVDFLSRRHFFSDWFATPYAPADDITDKVSGNYVIVNKQLNKKSNDSVYITGLPVVARKIKYIPAADITGDVLNNIQSGDFIGVYSPLSGLDVSHVGIFIKAGKQLIFRNASSLRKNRKVVDTPFIKYIKTKPGIIVLRSRTEIKMRAPVEITEKNKRNG